MPELRCEFAMKDYIAQPYWPERNQMIEILKKSGFNAVRSEEKRDRALKTYLAKIGLTMEDYNAIAARAERPWYRRDNDDPDSEIVIPRHQLSAAIVETLRNAPATIRGGYRPDSVRAQLRLSDFGTGKRRCDRIFERFVKLDGSNQRSLQRSEVICDFSATGTIDLDALDKKVLDRIHILLSHAISEVGVGASRKMGYGRGRLVSLECA